MALAVFNFTLKNLLQLNLFPAYQTVWWPLAVQEF